MVKSFYKEIQRQLGPLVDHSLYSQIKTKMDLSLFMERHAYAVFDFMSLAKALQHEFAPSSGVWTIPKSNKMARFINEIILCEESDELPSGEHMSHFEMYCLAMKEVSANCEGVLEFSNSIKNIGVESAIEECKIPKSSKMFIKSTFNTLNSGKIHEVAASFCFGREKCIPLMFQALLDNMGISEEDAPIFYHYLKRHIEVDGDSHGPLALEMIQFLCADDKAKWEEAAFAASLAIKKRIAFWDQVSDEISLGRNSH